MRKEADSEFRTMQSGISQIKAHVISHLNRSEQWDVDDIVRQQAIKSLVDELVLLENVPPEITLGELVVNHFENKESWKRLLVQDDDE